MDAMGHLRTINRHKLLVMEYCFKAGLFKQGLLHDLSKYTPGEFVSGAIYFQGNRSPNNAEKEDTGVSLAWLHHKGRNRHHLEYWIDYGLNAGGKLVGMKMPEKYVVEMFCDRIAACKVYKKDEYNDASPWEYFYKSKDIYVIHPESKKLLAKLLLMLKKYGEDRTFSYIRRNITHSGY